MGATQSLTWGTIPDDLDIGDEAYPMELNQSDLTAIAGAINQGIDARLEAVFATAAQRGNKMHVEIQDSASMRTLLRRLIESDNENAQDLASCIMTTLGYEWV